MKKGSYIVCICKGFQNFTYGKKYKLESDWKGGVLVDIKNDIGENCLLSFYAKDITEPYFVSIADWRDMKLKEIGV